MIIIKSDPEVDLMRQAGRITAGARSIARQMVAPGVTTRQINREVHKFITKSGATPSARSRRSRSRISMRIPRARRSTA